MYINKFNKLVYFTYYKIFHPINYRYFQSIEFILLSIYLLAYLYQKRLRKILLANLQNLSKFFKFMIFTSKLNFNFDILNKFKY